MNTQQAGTAGRHGRLRRSRLVRLVAVIAVVGGTVTTWAPTSTAQPPSDWVTVDTASTSGTTTAPLAAGVGYRLLATGTYTRDGVGGDAKCVDGREAPTSQLGVAVAGNAMDVTWRAFRYLWETCDPLHSYYFDVQGTGEPLTLSMPDSSRNVGSINVRLWRAKDDCPLPLAPVSAWAGSDLLAQNSFADPTPTTSTITYGTGRTVEVKTFEDTTTGGSCASRNHSFHNAWACNTRYGMERADDLDRASMFTGELHHGTWIVDSFTNIPRWGNDPFPKTWWDQSGHGGVRMCNIVVPTGADGVPNTYKIWAWGNYKWDARFHPGQLADSMCSTPAGTAIAFDPGSGSVYVADQGLDTVSAINRKRAVVPDPFRSKPNLYPSQLGLAVMSATRLLYVGDEGSPAVRVVDLGSNRVIATIDLGTPQFARVANLTAVAVNSKTQRVYAASNLLDAVFVIDGNRSSATFNKVIAKIPVAPAGQFSWLSLAVDEGLNRVHVGHYDARTLYTIDGASNAVTGTLPLTGNPAALSVHTTTHHVYVAERDVDSVAVVDGRTATPRLVTRVAGVGAHPNGIGVLSTANRAYVANIGVAASERLGMPARQGSVAVIDTTTNRLVGSVPSPFGGPDPEEVVVDPKNRKVYVANSTSHSVSVFSGTSSPSSAPEQTILVAATSANGKVQPISHWKPERRPYYGEDGFRNVGAYQSLWIERDGSVSITDPSVPHWVPTVPDASGKCADPVKDPEHEYTLQWKPKYAGPLQFWIYNNYYYEHESLGQLRVHVHRNAT